MTNVQEDTGSLCSDKKLCSSCGLCMTDAWPARESLQSCVFTQGWLGPQELDLFGRQRSYESREESRFGISRRRFAGSLTHPIPGAAWTGVITAVAKKAFETGMVDGVVTLHRGGADFFAPKPVLALSVEDILAGSGNKPVVSPTLVSLKAACEQNLRRLLVIGASCHVHALRDFKRRFPYLEGMEIFVVGFPCVDNVRLKTLRHILGLISRSAETVRHYEFMQDFTVHFTHEDGSLERVPYFCLPRELTGINFVVPACMCCFDYANSLADITVGYMGAPLDLKKMYQWIVVRTEKGEELLNLINDELQTVPEKTAGDCSKAVLNAAEKLVEQMRPGTAMEMKTGRKMPLWVGRILAAVLSRTGPRGLEYARYGVDMHMIRNYYYVKFNHPDLLATLVPDHVSHVVAQYGFEP